MRSTVGEFMQARLDSATNRLSREYAGVFSRETVERYVEETYDRLAEGASASDFLPLLTERFARDRLRALAQADGLLDKTAPEVLFVCVHNAGRSQIAAALTRSLSNDLVAVRSAGSHPSTDIDPAVVDAMSEIGLDLTDAFPKPMTDAVVRAAVVVITMGCGDACPIYPGKHYEDWEVGDPAGQDLDTVRAIRADVEARVRRLLVELGIPAAR